jgi:hypothetical protein
VVVTVLISLVWSAVLAVVGVLAVTGAVVVVTAAVCRSLIAITVWLLVRVTDLGMGTAVVVAAFLCHRDASADPLSSVLWVLIAATLAGLLLNLPHRRGLADRAAYLAARLSDATTSRRYDTTDRT